MASASSSTSTDIPQKEKYDVFLSFRGPDTRRTFTSHLKKALDDKKIDTYIDYDLERGEEIAPALLKAIEGSKISVVVFSKKYASSRWCLDELVHILECREKNGQHVLPVFYKTVVSHVRHQSRSYELDERFKDRTESERLKWKDALTKAANLSGFESKSFRDDSESVEKVVKDILKELRYESSSNESNGLVGVGSRVQEIESLLLRVVPGDDRVRCVVVWGMGGIGKTTLADAAFHQLSSQFDACCFLADVRENSGTQKELKALRNKLLRELLGDNTLDIQSKTIDRNTTKKLGRKKVLIVLDDVDDSRQLEVLIGHHHVPFGSGSRIIITTRDKKQLDEVMEGGNHDIVIYKVKELDDVEARQLLRLKAPKDIASATYSTEVLTKVVKYAAGVPLALRTLRSLIYKGALNEMEKISSEKLRSAYKVSYDVLTEDEKNIFLDIACFHKGRRIEDAKGRLNGCSLSVSSGIKSLDEMSLIELRNHKLWMHDVIQEMGREIVRQQCLEEAGKRTRLFTSQDINHVLRNNTGTAKVQVISAWEPNPEERGLNLNPHVFREMYNLRYLELGYIIQFPQGLEFLPETLRYIRLWKFPLTSLPPSFFSACFLVELHMPGSNLQTLGDKDQNLGHLKKIDLSCSRNLVEVRCLTKSKCLESIDLSGCFSLVQVPNISECLSIASINLQKCRKLVEVPSYFKNLHKLTFLNLSQCWLMESISEMPSNLEILLISDKRPLDWQDNYTRETMKLSGLPSSIWSLKKLVELDLSGCYHIQNFPSSSWTLNSLTSLDLSHTSLYDLPSSIECLSRIVSIDLLDCFSLVRLPDSIGKLKSLERLNLCGCSRLVSLPDSIGKLKSLERLNLCGCSRLVSLPVSISKLKSLQLLDLSNCFSLEFFPEILEPMECVKTLRLRGTKITELHGSIENLFGLEELDISSCSSLISVSNNIYKLRFLKDFAVAYCPELKKLPIPSSDILWSSLLSNLNLGGCFSLEEIPDAMLICFTSLEELYLSRSNIKSIPTSIKQLSGLTSLYVSNCEYLESLPELPYLLENLGADGCTNLETVSFSMTAVTQGLDQICDGSIRQETYTFRDCQKLSETAKSNLTDNAQLRIMRMANAFPKCQQDTRCGESYAVVIIYPGNEIPEWFTYQAEGSSINIKLPLHPSHTYTNFWQLVLCAVCTVGEDEDEYEDDDEDDEDTPVRYLDQFFDVCCNSNFTTNNGDCSEFNDTLPPVEDDLEDVSFDKSQVLVWYRPYWSSHVRNASEASFKFYLDRFPRRHDLIKIKRCGVSLLSSQGQDVKFVGVEQDVGEPKPEQVTSSKRKREFAY